jgi:replicative DNA helicase
MSQKENSLRFGNRQDKPRDLGIGKVPPQEVDMEEAVIGAMLLEKSALDVLDSLRPDDFYIEAHKVIYQAIHELFAAGDPVDMRSVRTQLSKTGKLDRIGGAFRLAELTAKVSSSANVAYHAKIIREMSMRRAIIEMCSNLQTKAYEDTEDVFDLIGAAQTMLISDALQAGSGSVITPQQAYLDFVNNLQARKDKDVTGVPSGFGRVDRMTAGWQFGDLVIIAARPGMGKTAFVVSSGENAGVPVAIFSLEMTAMQLTERRVSGAYEIDNFNLRRGRLTEKSWQDLTKDSKNISGKPLYIDDTPALSIADLRIRAIRMKAQYGIGLIIVDYLQLMRGTGSNREQEISSISRGLKALAKDLRIPIIALSQLSRAVETRGGDKRPQLSDLRESGAIEQDADVVMFLYRPEYYGITVDENGFPTAGKAEVIIAKNRSGSTEAVWVDFQAKYTKFLEAPEYRVPEIEDKPLTQLSRDDNYQPF